MSKKNYSENVKTQIQNEAAKYNTSYWRKFLK